MIVGVRPDNQRDLEGCRGEPGLPRLEVRAPLNCGANTHKSIGARIERFEIAGTVAYGLDGEGRLWRVSVENDPFRKARALIRSPRRRARVSYAVW
jgi:hypothetical protein